MVGLVLRFLVTVASIPLCAEYLPGVHLIDMTQALLLGAALGVIYLVLRPLARLVLTVFNFCTLGLLNVAVDAFLVWVAAGYFDQAIQLDSFWWAAAIAGVINLLRLLVDLLTGHVNR